MKRLALLLALGGCDAVFGLDTPKLHDAGGGGSDSGSADCSSMVGLYGKNGNAGWFQYCAVPGVRTFSNTTLIDTDDTSGMTCAGHEPFACLIESGTITLNGLVTVTGTRPLILAASTVIDINGILDVSSSPAGNGPAANPQLCSQNGTGATGMAGIGGGGGGGAGGSWSSMGGNGGRSGGRGLGVVGGGAAMPSDSPTMLRGGCAGASGGVATGGSGGGRGGSGGGAVYLMSPQIVLDATSQIESVGMFGTGGVSGGAATGSGGGAGGGTGGLIVFDTEMLQLPPSGGLVFANGGGAGAGGDAMTNGMTGMRSNAPGMAGTGGLATVAGGGVGGTGALGIAAAGTGGDGGGSTEHAGGGGGGGGQGFILLFTMGDAPNPTDTRFSPPFIIE
jgi:hypothetical protein